MMTLKGSVLSLTSDFQLFTCRNVSIESYLVLCHTERESDELLQVEDGHLGLRVHRLTSLRTVHIELHLTEGAGGCDQVCSGAVSARGNLPRSGQHVALRCELRMEAAALAPRIEPDRIRAEAAYKAFKRLGIIAALVIHDGGGAQTEAALLARLEQNDNTPGDTSGDVVARPTLAGATDAAGGRGGEVTSGDSGPANGVPGSTADVVFGRRPDRRSGGTT